MTKDLLKELLNTIEEAKEFIENVQDYFPDTEDRLVQRIIRRCEKAIEAAQAHQPDKQKTSCKRVQ